MFIKLFSIILLMLFISPHIHLNNYNDGKVIYLLPALTIAITSFGFSIIVPSLRSYFHDEIKQLRVAILVGSFIPLMCYILWNAVIFGLIPLQGAMGLARLFNATQPVTGLLKAINYYIPSDLIALLSHTFTSICVLTAFACVSLGLSDYLADGFKMAKQGVGRLALTTLTFLPPLAVVLFYPRAFILFLSLAGLCCVLLQALLPALMAWQCRYRKNLSCREYQVYGGKVTLLLAIIAAGGVILLASYELIVTM